MDMNKILAYVQNMEESLEGLRQVIEERSLEEGAVYVDQEQNVIFVSTQDAVKILDSFGNNSESVRIGKTEYILLYDAKSKLNNTVEVRGNEVAVKAQRIPLLRGGILLFQQSQLTHNALVRGIDCARKLPAAPLCGLLPVALGIKGIKHLGKARKIRLFHFCPVLRDGTVGEIHRLSPA